MTHFGFNPGDAPLDGEITSIPIDDDTWSHADTRRLLDVATRPSRYFALSCDVFIETYNSSDHMAAGEIAGMSAGRAVVLGYGFDPDATLQFDGAFAMSPDVAIGLAERLMQAALFAKAPLDFDKDTNDD